MLAGEGGDPRDREKLALVVRALRLRRERPEAFEGSYEPLDAGPDVCAFVRGGSRELHEPRRLFREDPAADVPRLEESLLPGDHEAPLARLHIEYRFLEPVCLGELCAGVDRLAGRLPQMLNDVQQHREDGADDHRDHHAPGECPECQSPSHA